MPEADPAATVIVLRPGEQSGFEVLMVRRNTRGFYGDMVVFPGGAVDWIDVPSGLDLEHETSHRRAALRELAEETGILATERGQSAAPELKGRELCRWLEDAGLPPAVDDLVLVSRWVTPEMAPRRFDTRFYLLECSNPPPVRLDTDELVGHDWVTATGALKRNHDGVWPMMLPTLAHLRWLSRRGTIGEALDAARGADGRSLIEPRRVEDGSLLPIHLPA